MELSNNSKQIITDELTYIAQMVRDEEDIGRKIFFFSGAYGMIYRILNVEFDPKLLLIHNTLQNTYMSINTRYRSIVSGEEKVIELPDGLFDKLADAIQELSGAILNNGDITGVLQKITSHGYVTTGNGYYLYQRGILEL